MKTAVDARSSLGRRGLMIVLSVLTAALVLIGLQSGPAHADGMTGQLCVTDVCIDLGVAIGPTDAVGAGGRSESEVHADRTDDVSGNAMTAAAALREFRAQRAHCRDLKAKLRRSATRRGHVRSRRRFMSCLKIQRRLARNARIARRLMTSRQ